jgi:hypothetical protein
LVANDGEIFVPTIRSIDWSKTDNLQSSRLEFFRYAPDTRGIDPNHEVIGRDEWSSSRPCSRSIHDMDIHVKVTT